MRYPFKFLDAYTKGDSDIFFGRTEEIKKLYNMLFETNMVWLYGASGTGKTSLIQCGLSNKFNPYDWYDIHIKRGKNLIESFEKALDEAGGNENNESNELNELTELLEQLDLKKKNIEHEKSIPETEIALTENAIRLRNIFLKHFKPIYLIFDQFEELFILGDEREKEQFLDILIDLQRIEQPVKMIFSIRSEFMFHLGKYEKEIPYLLHRKLELEPMDINKVKEVMIEIHKAKNLNVKIPAESDVKRDEIIEDIFEKVKDKPQERTIQLPYLQVFLDKMYMKVTEDPKQEKLAEFTKSTVSGMGDIGNVLSELLAELVVKILKQVNKDFPDEGIEEKRIWSVLSPFVTVDKTKSPIPKDTVYKRVLNVKREVIDSIISQLITGKVLRYVPENNLYELVHDSLCALIADRRDQDEKNILRAKELIKNQLHLYNDAKVLISASVMNMIEPYLFVLMDQKQLTGDEMDLVSRSMDEISLERDEIEKEKRRIQEEKEDQRERELKAAIVEAERSQKLRKRGMWVIGIAVTAAIILTGLLLYTGSLTKKAEAAREELQVLSDKNERNLQEKSLAYAELIKQQAINEAKMLETFGDSYRDNDDPKEACDNYQRAIDTLKKVQVDSLRQVIQADSNYQRILTKLQRCN